MTHVQKRIIGLTGGIATGKTIVSDYLGKNYQIPVLDADIYAREAVKSNSPIFTDIVTRYGQKILNTDGELNRHLLGEIIFNDNQEKIWLENQIHPFVYNCFVNNIKSLNNPILVLVIPLLFEAKMTDLVTEIWVVTCEEKQQIARLKTRNNLTQKQAIARIRNQLPLKEKEALADLVLKNNGNVKTLYQKIDKLIDQEEIKL